MGEGVGIKVEKHSMRGQNPKKRQRNFLSIVTAALIAGTMVFSVVFFLPNKAHALTASDVEIVYPRSAAQTIKDTNVTIEVLVNVLGSYKAELDVNSANVGSNDNSNWPVSSDGTINSFSGNTIGRFDAIKLPSTKNGQFRVRVTDTSSGQQAIKTTSVTLVDSLQFNGAMYIGASTGTCAVTATHQPVIPTVLCSTDDECSNDGSKICGGDAPGWVSASCKNGYGGAACAAPTTYTMTFAPSGSYATLQNDTWAGVTEQNSSPSENSLGWLTWNKKYCASGDAKYCIGGTSNYHIACTIEASCGGTDGTTNYCQSRQGGECVQNTDCGNLGFCVDTGTLPDDNVGDEEWKTSIGVLNRYYSAQVTEADKDGNNFSRYPGQLAGWAKFLVYGPDDGWAHLRGPEVSPNDLGNTYTAVTAVKPYQSCADCSISGAKCNICSKIQMDEGVPTPTTKNAACNSCSTCTGTSCQTCDVCDQYGVSFDQQKNQLVGYAWAGGDFGGALGWIKFDQVSANAILQAWLQTQYGDVFSNNNVTLSTPSASQFNATYLIQAGGTIGVDTRSGGQQPLYPQIGLPSSTTQYINVLGRLNFDEMLKPDNRYGKTTTLSSGDMDDYIQNTLSGVLNGGIYYHTGDATIDSSVTINNGSTASSGSGAGTFIIDGDLIINSDINYDPSSGSALANIPSVAWIVRGNITIGTNVKNLVGTFFALGCPGGTVPCGMAYKEGLFDAGTSSNQLVISGLVMAYKFDVANRSYTSQATGDPAVQVNYDGRFIANPPPGLQNLSALLPTVRQITP